jgi:hypothetical protein
MRLYAYCLGDCITVEALEGARGVEDAAVRVLLCGGLAAVVSEFGGERIGVTRENVFAHNRVNARVLAHTTPLPFRFGTLADEARLKGYVSANVGALRESLGRVRGCVEMGVKIIRDVDAQERGADTTSGADEEAAARVEEGVGGGTKFLRAKRRELLGDEARRRGAEAIAELLGERVADLVRESAVQLNASGALAVRAAHLVERERVEEYRARLRALGEERAADLRLLASGPWPPYSFGDPERTSAGR